MNHRHLVIIPTYNEKENISDIIKVVLDLKVPFEILIVDEVLVDGTFEKVYFHPLDNAASVGISPQDFLKFLEHTGHKPIRVGLQKTE